MKNNVFISTKDLCLSFPKYNDSTRSLKRKLLQNISNLLSKSDAKNNEFQAIKNISISIKKGDRLGLIGHNGAGKSSLLRAFSGIYKPSSGFLAINGKVNSLLDLNVGLNHEMTGIDNIKLKSILLGLNKKRYKDIIADIIEFSELGDFIHAPIRTYSSGMLLRLAFSISVLIDSDILIMDEWLSVGDSSFNDKAQKKLNSIIDKQSILCIASHDLNLIKKVCNRCIHLENGKIIKEYTIKNKRMYEKK